MSNQTITDRFVEGRRELQAKLVEILGSNNVYYQPPESIKLKYPCIVYFRSNIPVRKADNTTYKADFFYTITLIGTEPQNPIILKLLMAFDNIKYDRNFVTNSLYHDTFILYN